MSGAQRDPRERHGAHRDSGCDLLQAVVCRRSATAPSLPPGQVGGRWSSTVDPRRPTIGESRRGAPVVPGHRRVVRSEGAGIFDDAEPATGDVDGFDPHEAGLRCGLPREQRQLDRVEQVVHLLDLDGVALDDDAPRFAVGLVVAVDLERHASAQHCGGQLGAFGGAEHDAAVVDDVVDREDVGVVGDRDGESSHDARAEQLEALVRRQHRHAEAVGGGGGHVSIIGPGLLPGPEDNVTSATWSSGWPVRASRRFPTRSIGRGARRRGRCRSRR